MEASSRAALAEVRERLDALSRPASGVLERARDRLTGQPLRTWTEPLSAPSAPPLARAYFYSTLY